MINIGCLEHRARYRIDRIINPRDTLLSLRFSAVDIARWKRAAKCAHMTLQQWSETHLRQAHQFKLEALLLRYKPNQPRTKVLSQRFTAKDVSAWRIKTTYFSTITDWVEYVLNIASRGFES